MTFTMPETDRPNDFDRGINGALNAAVVDVSSEFSTAWAAADAVDGDLVTEWSSRGDGGSAFITLDLGSPQEVAGVEFITRVMVDGSATTSRFWATVDGAEQLGPFPACNPAPQIFNEVSFTGQVLRFDVESSTGGNTGAIEIWVYGP
jgi:hypothetical protein